LNIRIYEDRSGGFHEVGFEAYIYFEVKREEEAIGCSDTGLANTYDVDELVSGGEIWKLGCPVTAWFHAIAWYHDGVKRGID